MKTSCSYFSGAGNCRQWSGPQSPGTVVLLGVADRSVFTILLFKKTGLVGWYKFIVCDIVMVCNDPFGMEMISGTLES